MCALPVSNVRAAQRAPAHSPHASALVAIFERLYIQPIRNPRTLPRATYAARNGHPIEKGAPCTPCTFAFASHNFSFARFSIGLPQEAETP
jgi:hypothetical protein